MPVEQPFSLGCTNSPEDLAYMTFSVIGSFAFLKEYIIHYHFHGFTKLQNPFQPSF